MVLVLSWWSCGRSEPPTGAASAEDRARGAASAAVVGRTAPGVDLPPVSAGSIAGRVSVESGGLPPAQVCAQVVTPSAALEAGGEASAWGALDQCVSVDARGRYRIEGLLPARYRVSASAEGYLVVVHREAPNRPWIALRAGEQRDLEFVLRVRGEAIPGVVRDVAGGVVSGAVVTGSDGGRTVSDDEGRFTLWGMKHATMIVAAAAGGYAADSSSARPPEPPLTLWLSPESVLRGRLLGEGASGPLADVPVHLRDDGDEAARTDADGGFEIRGLKPGRYKPFVRDGGWCGSAEPSVGLGFGETSEPITITAKKCRVVDARVRARGTDEACASGRIEFLDVAGDRVRRAITDATGAATISGIEPGVYQVRIRCPEHVQREPEEWALGEAMRTEVVWEVEAGRLVSGLIRDHRGSAVARAHVEIVGAWGFLNVDADDEGRFAARVQPGLAALTPYHQRYTTPAKLELDVAELRDPAPVSLQFPPSYVIAEQVRARKGRLPGRLTVVARAVGSFGADSVPLQADGRFALTGLGPGAYSVVVQRAEGLREPGSSGEVVEPVVVELAERDAEVDFVIDGEVGVTLAGRVEDAAGDGEPDALVTVTNAMNHQRQRVLTEEDGRFMVEVVDDGAYHVTVTARDGSTLQQKDVKPGAPLLLKLSANRRVCGLVRGGAGGEGFTVDVDAGIHEVFAGGSPRWCIDRVPAGRRTFTGHSQRLGAAKAVVQVPASGAAPEVELEFSGRGTLRGRVVDGAGRPRADYKVWVLDVGGRLVGGNLMTDADGEFVLEGAPAGELTVIPLGSGAFPGRDALLARGRQVEVGTQGPARITLTVP